MHALGASPQYLHTFQIQKPPNRGTTVVVTTLAKKEAMPENATSLKQP